MMLRRKRFREPRTRREWQEAVDAAAFVLALDSARQYGLIDWAGKVNVERCAEVLARGEGLGYMPACLDELLMGFAQ